MKSKTTKIIYWVSTGLLTAMMLMSAGMYIFTNAEISAVFETLGFPSYIVIPLAIAKILGIATIWVNKFKSLKEWAYAGFFFDFVIAFFAHFMVGDGECGGAAMAMVLLLVSYFSWKKMSLIS